MTAVQTQIHFFGWAADIGDGVWRTTANPDVNCTGILSSLAWPTPDLVITAVKTAMLQYQSPWVYEIITPTLESRVDGWDSFKYMGFATANTMATWPQWISPGCGAGSNGACLQQLQDPFGNHPGNSIVITGPCDVPWEKSTWLDFLYPRMIAYQGSCGPCCWSCGSYPCIDGSISWDCTPLAIHEEACVDQQSNTMRPMSKDAPDLLLQTCSSLYGTRMRGACATFSTPAAVLLPCAVSGSGAGCSTKEPFHYSQWSGLPSASLVSALTPTHTRSSVSKSVSSQFCNRFFTCTSCLNQVCRWGHPEAYPNANNTCWPPAADIVNVNDCV